MNRLQELMDDIKNLSMTAKRNPVDYGVTGPAIAVAATQAKEELVKVKAEYGKELLAHCVPIFVMGPLEHQARFAEIAHEEYGTIEVYTGKLYRSLAARIQPSIGPTGEFGTQQASLLINGLKDAGVDLGVRDVAVPKHTGLPVVLKTPLDTITYVKNSVRASDGDELNRVAVEQELVALAVSARKSNQALPVVLLETEDMGEVSGLKSLFTRQTEPILLTEEPTKEKVSKIMVSIKKQLQTQSQPQSHKGE